jgi:multidrug efflux pump subunit AcrA (membrane-fusion protein)
VPLQALLSEGGATHAWLIDPATSTVRRSQVRIANVAGNEIVIDEGLKPPDQIVTAGVHQLKDGQKIRRLSDATELAPAGPATVRPADLKKG